MPARLLTALLLSLSALTALLSPRTAGGAGASCLGHEVTIIGSGAISGTGGNDVIQGSNGRDVVVGNGGNDVVRTPSDDVVTMGAGADQVGGGPANETLRGGDADDLRFRETGNDGVAGQNGLDDQFGDAGADNDDVYDGSADRGQEGRPTCSSPDLVTVSAAARALTPSSAAPGNDDRVYGEADNDVLFGGPGTGDRCDGGDYAEASCETSVGIP